MNLLALSRVTMIALVALAFSYVQPAAAGGEDAAEMYNQAQQLKRNHEFENARALFEIVADQDASGTWGKLAADELRYGLPLFEADYLIVKFGQSSHRPQQQDQYRQQAETLYKEIIADNADKPERIENVQRRLDQLAITSSYLNQARDFRLRNALMPLRMSLRERFNEYGKWPEEDWLREELGRVLDRAKYAKDKLTIDEYWVDDNRFRLHLLDQSTRKTLIMEGDGYNISIEEEDSL